MESTEERPIFVFGSGRSGTTLVQRVLNQAEDVCILGEHNGFLKGLAEAFLLQQAKGPWPDSTKTIVVQNEIKERLHDPSNWTAWFNTYSVQEVIEGYRNFIRSWFKPSWVDESRWGFKEIRYGTEGVIPVLAYLFPRAKFIYVVRNPVDVIASQIAFNWDDEESIVELWVSFNQYYQRLVTEYPDNHRLVRYESLVQKPDETLRDVFNWLDLALTPQVRQVIDMKEARGSSEKPPRYALTQEQLEEIVAQTADMVDSLGLALPVVPFRNMDNPTLGEELGLKDAGSEPPSELLECNESMLVVWSLCNGKRSVENIEDEVRSYVTEGPLWINSAIGALVKNKLVSVKVQ